MSADIPEKLKHADITGFAVRAAQLQQFKPVVAYWCQLHLSTAMLTYGLCANETGTGNYWVVNQILAKGLHTADEECLKYTTDLMDKLEKVVSTIYG